MSKFFPPSAPLAPPTSPRAATREETVILPLVLASGLATFVVPVRLAGCGRFERQVTALARRLERRYGRAATGILSWLALQFADLPDPHQTRATFRALGLLARFTMGRPLPGATDFVLVAHHPDDHRLVTRALQGLPRAARRAVCAVSEGALWAFSEFRHTAETFPPTPR